MAEAELIAEEVDQCLMDDDDDPEYLWATYMKGVKLHDSKHKTKKILEKHRKMSPPPPQKSRMQHDVCKNDSKLNGAMEKEVVDSDSTTELEMSLSDSAENSSEILESKVVTPTPVHTFCNGEKKPKMRTATDVISRIRWDPEIPAEHIIIGYLDRFIGLVEKPFNCFSWEDIASVDYDVLAIPKHRIIYFKYRHHKIWDKYQRLDLVFGSTENSKEMDIRELIEQIEEESHARDCLEEDDDDDDSDSDDSDIRVRIPFTVPLPTPRDSTEGRPNYFVAIRITNPDVLAETNKVMKCIRAAEPNLAEIMMPDAALHITLSMLHLPSDEDVERAAKVLEESWDDISEFMKDPITLRLEGVKTFNGFVLYIPVCAPTRFYELRTLLVNRLSASKVQLADRLDYVPHVTLLKLTKSRSRVLNSPYVDPFLYVHFKEHKFGSQVCDNIHMCVIGGEKRLDGFYKCVTERQFSKDSFHPL